MEFESTLERSLKERADKLRKAKEDGYKEPPEVKKVFNLVKDSVAFHAARLRTMIIAREMQPSITDTDLKIASDMQLAMASELILNLMKEGLITIKEVK